MIWVRLCYTEEGARECALREGALLYIHEKFLAELGTRLKQARKDRGWTLRDMIVLHGFHLTHWQSFEKGKGISVPSLLRICAVFDLTLEELVGGIGRTESAPEPEASPPSAAAPSGALNKRKQTPGKPASTGKRATRSVALE